MLEKLQIVKQRFDEVSDLIIQPDIITDQKRYVQLNREYKDLRILMDKREAYIEFTNNLAEAEEIIADGSDAEMVDMAKMQYEEAKAGIPKLEDVIAYEVHVQDFTDLLPLEEKHKGTFQGMITPGLKNSQGEKVGFDYFVLCCIMCKLV